MGELLKLLFNVTLAVDQADDKDKLVRLCTALDHAINLPFHSDADQQVHSHTLKQKHISRIVLVLVLNARLFHNPELYWFIYES